MHSILGIKWQDYVSNEEVLKRASLPSKESILLQVQLHLADYITRMRIYVCPKQSSVSSKKENAIVVPQQNITKTR